MAVLERDAPAPVTGEAGGKSPNPETGSRHCADCGQPLAADQVCCLECGSVVRDRRWYRRFVAARWPLRAGAASGTALVLSAIVGLGTSVALQKGGNIPKPIVTRIAAQPPPVSAPLVPPAAAPKTVAPAPVPAPAAKPAPATVARKPSTTTHAATTTSHSSGASTGGGSTGGGNASLPGNTYQRANPGNGSPSSGDAFSGGIPPSSANVVDPNHVGGESGSPSNVYDGDSSSAWFAAKPGVGIAVNAGGGSYKQLGIKPAAGHAGYTVEIYGCKDQAPPSSLSGCTPVSGSQSISGKTKISLSNGSYQWFVIWITQIGSSRAGIAETALF